jgi:TIR domain
MRKLFISHSSKDDAFVRELRQVLGNFKQDVWTDSRELRGGDPLWNEIKRGIEEASAYAVLVSANALQSEWVERELRHALEVQKSRGKRKFPVIPLSLNDTRLEMGQFFDEEPIYIAVSSGAGGIDAAMHPILVALGAREPQDVSPAPQPKVEALEELVFELTHFKFHEQENVRRASASARLVYEPGTP